jgi:4-diphosphocytidyl-2-C-methyl-D-erythritol kinase
VIRTPSKLNLFLEVTGRRPDGFHELVMIMEAVDLCDTLVAERKGSGVSLSCNRESVPTGEDNTIIRAARLFFSVSAAGGGVHFSLEKQIPAGGGLGGASGNAIGALFALMKLFDVTLPHETLYRIACRLGSDMPFFLKGGLSECRGRGEIVKLLGCGRKRSFLLVVPPFPLSTPKVYENLTLPLTRPRLFVMITLKSIEEQISTRTLFYNRLTDSAFELEPRLKDIVVRAKDQGVSLHLTGSGSCLFGLLQQKNESALFDSISRALEGQSEVMAVHNLSPW